MTKKLKYQEKASHSSRNWKLFIELKQLTSGLSHIFPCRCLCGYNSNEECICMGIVSSEARGFPCQNSSTLYFAFQPVVHEVVRISPFLS
jgi:hypothetical protein